MLNLAKINYNDELLFYVASEDLHKKIDKLDYIADDIVFYRCLNNNSSIDYNFVFQGIYYCNTFTIPIIILYNNSVCFIDDKIITLMPNESNYSIYHGSVFYDYKIANDSLWLYFDKNIIEISYNDDKHKIIPTSILHQKRKRLFSYAGKLHWIKDPLNLDTILI